MSPAPPPNYEYKSPEIGKKTVEQQFGFTGCKPAQSTRVGSCCSATRQAMAACGDSKMHSENVERTLQERGQKYGKFSGHAEVSQDLKLVIRTHLKHRGKILALDQQEALEMICHKIARIINGDADYADSWHDIAGYSTLIVQRLKGDDDV